MRRRGDIFTLELFGDDLVGHTRPTSEPSPGSLDSSNEVRAVITRMIKDSPYDRYEIAARVSQFVGREIRKTTLDAWTADSKLQHRFPFELTEALEWAVDSYALTDWLARKRGGRFVVGEQVLLAELGRIQGARADLKRYEGTVKKQLDALKGTDQ